MSGPARGGGVSRAALQLVESRALVQPWTGPGTAYKAGQETSNGGTNYLAVDNHTSGATFAGDLAAHWVARATGGGATDATTLAKGIVQLAGDLAGTAAAPTVPGVATNASAISTHAGRTDNPHAVTKTQVGLGNADNTSDIAKPVSTAQAAMIGARPWVTGTLYGQYQITTNGGFTYSSTVAHTSGATFAADLLAGKWSPLPIGGGKAASGLLGSRAIPNTDRTLHMFGVPSQSDAIKTGGTARYSHTVLTSGNGLEVWVGHVPDWFANPGTITTSIQVSVWLEVAGVSYPVAFPDGALTTLLPNQIKRGQLIGVAVAAGDIIFERTEITVASGNRWLMTRAFGRTGDSQTYGTPGTYLGSSTGALASGSAVGYGFGTLMIGAIPTQPAPFIIGRGDSITAGSGWTGAPDAYETSYFETALRGAIPLLNLSRYAEYMNQSAAAGYLATSGVGTFRNSLAASGNIFLWAYGDNDVWSGLQTQAAVQANMIKCWRIDAGRGPVYQATILPRTTSTDSWATLGNQTLTSGAANTVRVAINAWLRDGAPLNPTTFASQATGTATSSTCVRAGSIGHPLTRIFDISTPVETAVDSGFWKSTGAASGWTADGIHPTATGHNAMAATITSASVITDWHNYPLVAS